MSANASPISYGSPGTYLPAIQNRLTSHSDLTSGQFIDLLELLY
jgi:hypothetical protein